MTQRLKSFQVSPIGCARIEKVRAEVAADVNAIVATLRGDVVTPVLQIVAPAGQNAEETKRIVDQELQVGDRNIIDHAFANHGEVAVLVEISMALACTPGRAFDRGRNDRPSGHSSHEDFIMADRQKTAGAAAKSSKGDAEHANGDNEQPLLAEPAEFLKLTPPTILTLLENVVLVFAKNIPEDARSQCRLEEGTVFDSNATDSTQRGFLLQFVRERLDMVARREYGMWLNGRLPFITPRELLLWRLRQYVEYIWAFQLPDDDDLALIFNTTKLRAAGVAADFLARFRKALLFPIAIRRLYRILRGEDPVYAIVDRMYELNRSFGSTFQVPSRRYQQDANALIEEFRLREDVPLKDAQLVNKSDNILWVHKYVLDIVKDDNIRRDLLRIYRVPREAGYEG